MNIQIANRLREYRRASGYSQEELAEKLGVSRQAVSKWERAEASPDTDNLIALAALYGVTIDELINGSARDGAASSAESKVDAVDDVDDDLDDDELDDLDDIDEDDDLDDDDLDDLDDIDDDDDLDDDDSHHHSGFGVHIGNDKGAHVHIGFGGIHIDDHQDHVHIDRHGIHIDDSDGDNVHIDADGINVSEAAKEAKIMIKDGKLYVNDKYICDVNAEDTVSLRRGGVYVNDEYVCAAGNGDTVTVKGGHVYVNGKERRRSVWPGLIDAVVPVLAVIAYLVMGFLFPWGWRLGWLVFFLVPVFMSLGSAIRHGNPSRFAYPVLVAGVYLFLGLWFGWWHPWWILFLTIPVYYAVCDAINRARRR